MPGTWLYYVYSIRTASEEVTLSSIKAKCIPCLLYGLEACPIGAMKLNSQNFAVKRILFKIFRTNSNDIVQSCQLYFNFPDISVILTARKKKFLTKFSVSDNCLCTLFNSKTAKVESPPYSIGLQSTKCYSIRHRDDRNENQILQSLTRNEMSISLNVTWMTSRNTLYFQCSN